MGKEHRLRPLQMSVARHHHLLIPTSQAQQRPLHATQPSHRLADYLTGVEAHIQRDLVIAGAPGVQAPCCRTNELVQPPLDVHVQVFQRGVPREVP